MQLQIYFIFLNCRKAPPGLVLPQQDKAELAFILIDKDRDGTITKEEMVRKLKHLTMDQVDKVLFLLLWDNIDFFTFLISGIF